MPPHGLLIDPAYLIVLRTIYERLDATNINWAVTGSLGFALQGVPVVPHDIDLQTDRAGAYAIERRFAEHMLRKVTFSATERLRSHFGALLINGIEVEIMGDLQHRRADGGWEPPVDVQQHTRIVEIDGMRVPVLALEYEYQAYLRLGRIERAEILRRWLDGQAD